MGRPVRYFTRQQLQNETPSRRDGLPEPRERYFRRTYCGLIKDSAARLQMNMVTHQTAIVFLHRFYMSKSMLKNDRMIMSMAALFLAGKVEDNPKALRDVIYVTFDMRERKKKASSSLHMLKDPVFYEAMREAVLTAERALMYTLGFDFRVDHAFGQFEDMLIKYNLYLINPELAPNASRMLADSYRLPLCLQYPLLDIAIACIHTTTEMFQKNLKLPKVAPLHEGVPWWEHAGMTQEKLLDLQSQLLAQYDVPKASKDEASEKGAAAAGKDAAAEVANADAAEQRDAAVPTSADPAAEAALKDQHEVSTPVQVCESGELPDMDISGP